LGFSGALSEAWINPQMNTMALAQTTDGSIWVAADNGAARLRASGASQYFTNISRATAIRPGAGNRVWLGTTDQGLFCWSAGELKRLPDDSLVNETIFALAEDALGQVWVGTQLGLHCYDANFQPKAIPALHTQVKALLVDRHGS
jgi:ligand-binding sensor domain-containing protein